MTRGSQMHVLDWAQQPTFVVDLLRLVRPVACSVDAASCWHPMGHERPEEARLETFGPEAFPEKPAALWKELHDWWLVHGGNTPNWDIALRANIEGEPGLILVEAKANHPELDEGPKARFRPKSGQSPEAQQRSRERSGKNDDSIRAALQDAQDALARHVPKIALGCDTDYQLSNRIAFAWKLASKGIPTVLVYLGFLGDAGLETSGLPMFRERDDWERALAAQLQKIAPLSILERPIPTDQATMWMLQRSKDVLRHSPPAQSKPSAGTAPDAAGEAPAE